MSSADKRIVIQQQERIRQLEHELTAATARVVDLERAIEIEKSAQNMLAAAPAHEDDEIVMPAPTVTGNIGVRLRKTERPPLQFESDAIEDADAQDARRWRYMREHRRVSLLCDFFGNGCVNRTIEEVDAAIDAAIAREKDRP